MSGTDKSVLGIETQPACHIGHLDSADLFILDFQAAGRDESRYANSQETASDLHMTSANTKIPGGAELLEANDRESERSRQWKCARVSSRAQCCL